jgi:hypothetical protein
MTPRRTLISYSPRPKPVRETDTQLMATTKTHPIRPVKKAPSRNRKIHTSKECIIASFIDAGRCGQGLASIPSYVARGSSGIHPGFCERHLYCVINSWELLYMSSEVDRQNGIASGYVYFTCTCTELIPGTLQPAGLEFAHKLRVVAGAGTPPGRTTVYHEAVTCRLLGLIPGYARLCTYVAICASFAPQSEKPVQYAPRTMA